MGKTAIQAIEKMQAMEEKFGVSLEGLYAEYDDVDVDAKYLNVRGEIIAKNGSGIPEDIEIVMTAYNVNGQVISTASVYIDAENFFGISPFEFCQDIIEMPVKVRVYPKK